MKRLLAAACSVIACVIVFAVLSPFAAERIVPASAGASAAGTETKSTGRKAVLVVIDRIGIDDYAGNAANLPNLSRLIGAGGVGLMNAKVRNDAYGQGSYLLIGAGGRAFAGCDVGFAFNSTEFLQATGGRTFEAGDAYESRTGRAAPAGSVLNLNIEKMIATSDSNEASSGPGMLGESMKKASKKVAIVGNADSLVPTPGVEQVGGVPAETEGRPLNETPEDFPIGYQPHREASSLAIDADGFIPRGDVSPTISKKIPRLPGITTDFGALVGESKRLLASSDFLVVDMGETSRVDEQSAMYSEKALSGSRARALVECDRALGEIMGSIDLSRDLLIVCTPTPTARMIADDELLTPLVIAGAGFEEEAHLRSPTTRRRGLVSNYDIAPTILEFFGIEVPPEMEGRACESAGGASRLGYLEELRDKAVHSAGTRTMLLRVFIITASLVLLVLLILSFVGKGLIAGHKYFWSIVLLSLLSAPLVYLLVPLLDISGKAWAVVASVGGALAIGALPFVALTFAGRRRGARVANGEVGRQDREVTLPIEWAASRSILLICAATLVLILMDPLLGSPMISFSPFGSLLVAGGRYYGIGNIYMAVAFSAAILVGCLLLDFYPGRFEGRRRSLPLVAAITLLTVLVVGYPRLGANVGGFIAGLVASLVTLAVLAGVKAGWKQVAALVVLVAVCLALLFVIDLVLPGSASHAGKAVKGFSGGGIPNLIKIGIRKQAVNWKLMWQSTWKWFLFTSIICAFVWHLTLDIFNEVKREYRHMPAAWLGMAAGLVAAVLFNDTGVEAAGTIMLYLMVPTFLLFSARWSLEEPEVQ